jgi:hypothetical protein
MTIDEAIAPFLGSARLEHIARLDDSEWQAIVRYENDLFRGTGETIEEAIAHAVEGQTPVGELFAARFNGGEPKAKAKPVRRNILVELGMYQARVTRR